MAMELIHKRFICLILTLVSNFSQHICNNIITSERNEKPQEDGHFVIPGLDLNSLDTFTMCGRFNVYQFIVHSEIYNGKYRFASYREKISASVEGGFNVLDTKHKVTDAVQGIFPGFGVYSLVTCDEICALIPKKNRKLKHVFVWTYFFGQKKVLPASLKPNSWNSFCLKVNSTAAVLNLNNKILFTKNDEKMKLHFGILLQKPN